MQYDTFYNLVWTPNPSQNVLRVYQKSIRDNEAKLITKNPDKSDPNQEAIQFRFSADSSTVGMINRKTGYGIVPDGYKDGKNVIQVHNPKSGFYVQIEDTGKTYPDGSTLNTDNHLYAIFAEIDGDKCFLYPHDQGKDGKGLSFTSDVSLNDAGNWLLQDIPGFKSIYSTKGADCGYPDTSGGWDYLGSAAAILKAGVDLYGASAKCADYCSGMDDAIDAIFNLGQSQKDGTAALYKAIVEALKDVAIDAALRENVGAFDAAFSYFVTYNTGVTDKNEAQILDHFNDYIETMNASLDRMFSLVGSSNMEEDDWRYAMSNLPQRVAQWVQCSMNAIDYHNQHQYAVYNWSHGGDASDFCPCDETQLQEFCTLKAQLSVYLTDINWLIENFEPFTVIHKVRYPVRVYHTEIIDPRMPPVEETDGYVFANKHHYPSGSIKKDNSSTGHANYSTHYPTKDNQTLKDTYTVFVNRQQEDLELFLNSPNDCQKQLQNTLDQMNKNAWPGGCEGPESVK